MNILMRKKIPNSRAIQDWDQQTKKIKNSSMFLMNKRKQIQWAYATITNVQKMKQLGQVKVKKLARKEDILKRKWNKQRMLIKIFFPWSRSFGT
jgi:hypothetical protein